MRYPAMNLRGLCVRAIRLGVPHGIRAVCLEAGPVLAISDHRATSLRWKTQSVAITGFRKRVRPEVRAEIESRLFREIQRHGAHSEGITALRSGLRAALSPEQHDALHLISWNCRTAKSTAC